MSLALTLALLIGQSGGASAACIKPETQQQMNACTRLDYEQADDELNQQWALTAAEMRRRDTATSPHSDGRPGYYDQLLGAQRVWIVFRDAHCTSEGYLVRGGSAEPTMVAGCKALLTRQRMVQLRDLAQYPE